MEVLSIISDNFMVFLILVIILIINFCCILYLIIKERKDDKEEIKEILEELKPKEEQPDIELEKQQDQKLEKNKKEVEEMLIKMQHDLETKPEDVVSHFENEQEEKSIISYQELLDSVKSSNDVKVTPVKIEPEKIEIEETYQPDDMEDTVPLESIQPPIDNQKKFKGTEFISPIFGKQENNVKYPSVPKRVSRLDNMVAKQEKTEEKKPEPKLNLVEKQKLDDELRKNNDFLQALKEFRKSLD